MTFSGHARPFAVHLIRCLNSRRVDREMLLWFDEIPPEPGVEPGVAFGGLSFALAVDPETWCERMPPARSEKVAAHVAEFLRDATPEVKNELAQQRAQLAEVERQLAGLTATVMYNPKRNSVLSYADFFADPVSPVSYTFRFDHGDKSYLIEDLYCGNPECHCNGVELEFVAFEPASDAVVFEPRFVAHLDLLPGAGIKPHQVVAGTEDEALRIATEWWAANPDALELFRTRYARIRQAAEQDAARCSAANDAWDDFAPAEPIRRQAGKIGRNQPCPCGSGKKYKKCCGA